ncbi:hypothetical protein DFH27DRAFT_651749 [Peziza echinospora]|nr:hypothetical protein DFH27DRAFT_651749 [Peziza echinospora]
MADVALTKLTVEAAKTFVGDYYNVLDQERGRIASFYAPNAGIVWNGNTITSGGEFAAFYAKMPPTQFDVQSYDAQPTNPDGRGSCSFLLMVSGSVTIGPASTEVRAFNETFLMKPDATDNTRFLIATQGFRLVK